MTLIEDIAQECSFDVGQIMADVLCPDYDGPELSQLVDVFNKLPQEVRGDIVEMIGKRQQEFAQAIVQQCVDVVNEVGGEPARWINHTIEKRFGW